MALHDFVGTVHLLDNHGLTARKDFNISVDDATYATEEARFGAAAGKLASLAEKLDNISDAKVTDVTLKSSILAIVANLKANPGEQGVGEGAIVRIYKEDGDLHPYWVPAASETSFQADFATWNTGAAVNTSYFNEFNADSPDVLITFSDGEQLDETQGSSGQRDGYYATRPRSTKD